MNEPEDDWGDWNDEWDEDWPHPDDYDRNGAYDALGGVVSDAGPGL